ncbi:MAG: response regulator [Symploca sp. SIO2G7]|nr:response regulator [Symploca sp. SIO2G7]
MMRCWKKSLLVQLVGSFFILSLLTISIVCYTSFNQARESLKLSVFNELELTASLKEGELSRWVMAQREYFSSLGQLPEISTQAMVLLSGQKSDSKYQFAYEQLEKSLISFVTRQSALKELFLLTRSGRILVSTNPTQIGKYQPLAQYSEVTEKPTDTFVSNFYRSLETGKPTITVATPILNDADKRLGMLVVNLNLEQIDEIIREHISVKEDCETYLVGKFGSGFSQRNVLISAERFGSVAFPDGIESEGIARAMDGNNGQGLYENYRGVPVIGVYRWLTAWDVALLVEMNQSQAFAPASRLARSILLMGMILAQVLAVAMFLIARRLTQPILAIIYTATQVAAGNLTSTAPVLTENEIGILARVFNQMIEQLRFLYTGLEEQVEERTAALRQANKQLRVEIAERRRAEQAAEAANHAKGQFLTNMSHELRTPLNGILGYTQIMQHSSGLTPQQQEGIDTIHTCGNHLLTLINDILDISKIEAQKMELYPHDFHFSHFLRVMTQMCQIRAQQKEIAFTYQPHEQLPTVVYADEKRLRQVLLNLLGNAIKFTHTGSVTFKVSVIGHWSLVTSEEQKTTDKGQRTKDKIRFEIEDTGVGIAKEELGKIFEPFEQVGESNNKSEGTGLGLAITQKIISLMGSQLQVKSTLGVGSTFWFELELLQASASMELAPAQSFKDIIGYQGEKQKILVVDDRWENRAVLVHLLEPVGFEVREASNGEEGLEQAQEFVPDLIIIDLVMPGMDGWSLARCLRQLPQFQQTILIACSASVSEVDQLQSREVGCHDFLPKPIQVEDLFIKIQDYLELSWVYNSSKELANQPLEAEADSGQGIEVNAIIPPPREELTVLYDLARKGLIDSLIEQAEKLKALDEQYLTFAQEIQDLAQGFQLKTIRKILKQYLENI